MERYFKMIASFSIEEQNVYRKKSNVALDQTKTDVIRQESDIWVESNVAQDKNEIHVEGDIQVKMDVRDEDI